MTNPVIFSSELVIFRTNPVLFGINTAILRTNVWTKTDRNGQKRAGTDKTEQKQAEIE